MKEVILVLSLIANTLFIIYLLHMRSQLIRFHAFKKILTTRPRYWKNLISIAETHWDWLCYNRIHEVAKDKITRKLITHLKQLLNNESTTVDVLIDQLRACMIIYQNRSTSLYEIPRDAIHEIISNPRLSHKINHIIVSGLWMETLGHKLLVLEKLIPLDDPDFMFVHSVLDHGFYQEILYKLLESNSSIINWGNLSQQERNIIQHICNLFRKYPVRDMEYSDSRERMIRRFEQMLATETSFVA